MFNRIIRVPFLLLVITLMIPLTVLAASTGSENMMKAEQYVDQALASANEGQLSEAQKNYQKFSDTWPKIEDSIKAESGQAYTDIENSMGQVDYAFIQNNQNEVIKVLQGLKSVNEKYIQGQYQKGELKKESITLGDFITYLQQTKAKAQNKDQKEALADMEKVRQSWLSVEGVVVAQSATVYNDSERDMVAINAMLLAGNYQGATHLLDSND